MKEIKSRAFEILTLAVATSNVGLFIILLIWGRLYVTPNLYLHEPVLLILLMEFLIAGALAVWALKRIFR